LLILWKSCLSTKG